MADIYDYRGITIDVGGGGESKEDAYNFVNKSNYKTKRVCLAHFSDIHGKYDMLTKVMAYCTKYADYISDILFTGDYVNYFSDSMNWWGSVAGASNILGCMGNHEIQDSSAYAKTSHIGKDAYDKFFAPYIANWNVTQPSNASTDGKCYYYKDYGVVRLIVLDWMDYNATQKSWFTSILTDAKARGKQVVVASHFPSREIKKHYNSFDSLGDASVKDDGWLALAPEYKAHEEIQSFINAGGVFICWLCGHMHRDNFGELVGYPNQIVVDVTTCRNDFGSTDLYTTDDTALNLVSIDSANGIFYLNRLGTNLDYYGRERIGLAYDYINHKLIRDK